MSESAETAKTEAKAAKAAKAPKANGKTEAPSTRRSFPDAAIITMGVDGEGRPYSAENSPKRAGSKAHRVFACYKDGMTVADFKQAVGDSGEALNNLRYDAGRGYVSVKE